MEFWGAPGTYKGFKPKPGGTLGYSGEFGDFGQIPGPSSSLFGGCAAAAAAFLCHYYLLRT